METASTACENRRLCLDGESAPSESPLTAVNAANFVSARLVSMEPSSAEDEDADVARERLRVHEGGAQDDLLRVCDLTKVTSSSPSGSSSVADCLIARSFHGT